LLVARCTRLAPAGAFLPPILALDFLLLTAKLRHPSTNYRHEAAGAGRFNDAAEEALAVQVRTEGQVGAGVDVEIVQIGGRRRGEG
jgi:hypothetical protein